MMTTGTVPGNAMTHRERIQATLRGEAVDRPPVSLWRHFPREDETVEGLVKATVRFQREYDFDLVKLMPTGMYGVIDYGVAVQLSITLKGMPVADEQQSAFLIHRQINRHAFTHTAEIHVPAP